MYTVYACFPLEPCLGGFKTAVYNLSAVTPLAIPQHHIPVANELFLYFERGWEMSSLSKR